MIPMNLEPGRPVLLPGDGPEAHPLDEQAQGAVLEGELFGRPMGRLAQPDDLRVADRPAKGRQVAEWGGGVDGVERGAAWCLIQPVTGSGRAWAWAVSVPASTTTTPTPEASSRRGHREVHPRRRITVSCQADRSPATARPGGTTWVVAGWLGRGATTALWPTARKVSDDSWSMVRLRENQVPQNTPITNANRTMVVA
jgi:hypothetical protein